MSTISVHNSALCLSYLTSLPAETLHTIFSFLTPKDHLRLLYVCKRLHSLALKHVYHHPLLPSDPSAFSSHGFGSSSRKPYLDADRVAALALQLTPRNAAYVKELVIAGWYIPKPIRQRLIALCPNLKSLDIKEPPTSHHSTTLFLGPHFTLYTPETSKTLSRITRLTMTKEHFRHLSASSSKGFTLPIEVLAFHETDTHQCCAICAREEELFNAISSICGRTLRDLTIRRFIGARLGLLDAHLNRGKCPKLEIASFEIPDPDQSPQPFSLSSNSYNYFQHGVLLKELYESAIKYGWKIRPQQDLELWIEALSIFLPHTSLPNIDPNNPRTPSPDKDEIPAFLKWLEYNMNWDGTLHVSSPSNQHPHSMKLESHTLELLLTLSSPELVFSGLGVGGTRPPGHRYSRMLRALGGRLKSLTVRDIKADEGDWDIWLVEYLESCGAALHTVKGMIRAEGGGRLGGFGTGGWLVGLEGLSSLEKVEIEGEGLTTWTIFEQGFGDFASELQYILTSQWHTGNPPAPAAGIDEDPEAMVLNNNNGHITPFINPFVIPKEEMPQQQPDLSPPIALFLPLLGLEYLRILRLSNFVTFKADDCVFLHTTLPNSLPSLQVYELQGIYVVWERNGIIPWLGHQSGGLDRDWEFCELIKHQSGDVRENVVEELVKHRFIARLEEKIRHNLKDPSGTVDLRKLKVLVEKWDSGFEIADVATHAEDSATVSATEGDVAQQLIYVHDDAWSIGEEEITVAGVGEGNL